VLDLSPQETYKARLKRSLDAASLKVPDRAPVFGPHQKFPYSFAGVTLKEAMNDYALARGVAHKFVDYFQPDLDFGPVFAYPTEAIRLLDWKAYRWPGHGLDDDTMYQFIEDEYTTADEYDEFICDPSDFRMRKWANRQFGALAGFAQFAPWRQLMHSGWMGLDFWVSSEFQETLEAMTAGIAELK